MTLVADASSLILLAKSGVLKDFIQEKKIMIPQRVYEEIIAGKEKFREDAFLIEKLVKENKIEVVKPNEKIKEQVRKLFGLSGGEQEAISLALEKRLSIITDDKKCLNAAKAIGIDFITSLDVIVALYKKRVINKEKALECVDRLEEYGWYANDIIKSYKEAIK